MRRAQRLVEKCRFLMADGAWWTIQAMAAALGCTQTGAAARIRDQRKERYGRHKIVRRSAGRIFEYRMTPHRSRLGKTLGELAGQAKGDDAFRKIAGL